MPQDDATRAQVAAILMRFKQNTAGCAEQPARNNENRGFIAKNAQAEKPVRSFIILIGGAFSLGVIHLNYEMV